MNYKATHSPKYHPSLGKFHLIGGHDGSFMTFKVQNSCILLGKKKNKIFLRLNFLPARGDREIKI